MLAVYAIVNGNEAGWTSTQTWGCSRPRRLLLVRSSRSRRACANRSMPLRLFRLRNVATANVVGVLWAAAMFAWFFISALYMQLVLGYTPMQVGLAFLPANLIMAAFSLGLSAKMVMRFGIAGRSRRHAAGGDRPGAVRARAAWRPISFATCCRGCCCSASARHGVQSGAAGGDERRQCRANRVSPRAWSTRPS